MLPESQRIRYAKKFAQFEKHPLSTQAASLFKQYLEISVLAPRRTEYSFWAVSCMPGGSVNAWPRLLCVNAAMMELFVVGWERQAPQKLWSFVNVTEDVLTQHWPSLRKLKKTYPFLDIERSAYKDAGQHQLRIVCNADAPMKLLLQDPSISIAAATLTLRVMRKRATIYGKYHCPQLADLALFS